MGAYIERLRHPENAAGLSRKDRAAGRYLAYVPDELGGRLPALGASAQAAAEDALAVLARVDERIGERGRYLNHLLIRSESISSSWLEGNRISPKRLAIAELLHEGPRQAIDAVANVRATEAAIAELADRSRPIAVEDIVDLQHVIEPRLDRGGCGGSRTGPAAPAGRRCALRSCLRRCPRWRDWSRTSPASPPRPRATRWCGRRSSTRSSRRSIRFALAAERAAGNAVRLAADIATLDARVREELVVHRRARGTNPAVPRRDAVVLRILDTLASDPVLTAESVSTGLGVSPAAAHRALTELAEAGVLGRAKERGRLVCWTADRHLALVALTERSNRVGGEDTRNRKPARGPALPDANTVPDPPFI